MNAGLSNLTALKGQLLAASLRADTDYDAAITAIGLGVAAQFDAFCNRGLARAVAQQDIFRADRRHWWLNRYPVEAITATEKKDSEADGYVSFSLPPDGSALIQSMDLTTGYIMFIALQGYYFSMIRVTYTGGFFFEPLEPQDSGFPTAMPATASPLPNDVQLAFFLQCQNIWKRYDKVGAQIAQDPEKQSAIGSLELADAVKQLLRPYVRHQIS